MVHYLICLYLRIIYYYVLYKLIICLNVIYSFGQGVGDDLQVLTSPLFLKNIDFFYFILHGNTVFRV